MEEIKGNISITKVIAILLFIGTLLACTGSSELLTSLPLNEVEYVNKDLTQTPMNNLLRQSQEYKNKEKKTQEDLDIRKGLISERKVIVTQDPNLTQNQKDYQLAILRTREELLVKRRDGILKDFLVKLDKEMKEEKLVKEKEKEYFTRLEKEGVDRNNKLAILRIVEIPKKVNSFRSANGLKKFKEIDSSSILLRKGNAIQTNDLVIFSCTKEDIVGDTNNSTFSSEVFPDFNRLLVDTALEPLLSRTYTHIVYDISLSEVGTRVRIEFCYLPGKTLTDLLNERFK